MKKLFLAICFIIAGSSQLQARVQEVLDMSSVPQPQQQTQTTNPKVTEVSADGLGKFLMTRIQSTVIQDPKDVKTEAMFVAPSDDPVGVEKEKGTFQKIYEEAMQRATAGEQYQGQREDLAAISADMADTREQQQQEWDVPDFPVINALLPPDNRREVVPAREHIPYLMTNIEILSNGMTKFNETVVVVANGNKLRHGLTKALPKYIYSRENKPQKVDYSLLGVTVNDQPIDYKMVEQGERILFIPQNDYELEPGVYTYNFKYVNSQGIWDYGDFKEFYWDVNGSAWNLIVAKAGATVTLPPGIAPLGQEFYLGYPQYLRSDWITLVRENDTTYGYAAQNPLFIGEGFHLIISLPEDAVMNPTFSQKLMLKIDRYSDILFSLLGLAAIWISFVVSWKFIKASKGQLKFSLKKNGIMLRYLAFNKFDLASFGSFLLELYKKNIIDIQKADDTILLIKRTDNLHSLSKAEKKAVEQLFANNEAVLNVNKSNFLKIKRAAVYLEKELHSKLRNYIIKLNSGYLFFSLGMLAITEFFIAAMKVNVYPVWSLELLTTLVMLVGIIVFNLKMLKLYTRIIAKVIGIIIIMAGFAMQSALISPWAVLFILLSLIIISIYTSSYAQRNGLLREQIREASDMRNILLQRKENLMLGRDIVNQQANIMALNLVTEFNSDEKQKNEYFKLDAVQALIDKLRA